MQKFSQIYHQYCKLVEESVREKLGRPITETEQYSVRNIGSLLLLEAFERDLVNARSLEETVVLLTQQAQISQETLARTREGLIKQMAVLLRRSLSAEEERTLRTIQMIEDALLIHEKLIETARDRREAEFRSMIDKI